MRASFLQQHQAGADSLCSLQFFLAIKDMGTTSIAGIIRWVAWLLLFLSLHESTAEGEADLRLSFLLLFFPEKTAYRWEANASLMKIIQALRCKYPTKSFLKCINLFLFPKCVAECAHKRSAYLCTLGALCKSFPFGCSFKSVLYR